MFEYDILLPYFDIKWRLDIWQIRMQVSKLPKTQGTLTILNDL